jgi:hypothetical protein
MLSVTFTPTDVTDYTSVSTTVQLVVNKTAPTITWANPAAIPYGTALSAAQLNATANVPGTFTYNPAAGTVLRAGSQILSVTFTPNDAVDYNPATSSVTVLVNQAVSVLTWASPAPITYGTPLSAAQLNATASVPGTFVYSPAAGAVLGAGAQTLSVKFTPTDAIDYSTATAMVGLAVAQAKPVITWATPAPIAFGTPLSSTQLDATANVPGTFVYAPAAGTVLPGGTQSLSVLFTPADSADYSTASASVALVVKQAQVKFSATSINFGNVVLGKVGLQSETITNVGNVPLVISKVLFTPGPGTDKDDFGVLSICGTVAPGSSCIILIGFEADDLGSHSATLTITDNVPGSPQTINVSANVVKH